MRYVGSGVLASAAGMDKHYMKVVFAGHGLPVGPYAVITDRAWRTDRAAAMDTCAGLAYPLFVKPARAGSSMGITRVDDPSGLEAAIEVAREHDPKVLVEEGIAGREIECAVLEGHGTSAPRTSEVAEIVVHDNHAFYDFEAKYLAESDVDLSCPADVPEEVAKEVRRLAAEAFESLGCEGLARVDCFVTPEGRVVLNEINTMPGFTPHSMYPRMWPPPVCATPTSSTSSSHSRSSAAPACADGSSSARHRRHTGSGAVPAVLGERAGGCREGGQQQRHRAVAAGASTSMAGSRRRSWRPTRRSAIARPSRRRRPSRSRRWSGRARRGRSAR